MDSSAINFDRVEITVILVAYFIGPSTDEGGEESGVHGQAATELLQL